MTLFTEERRQFITAAAWAEVATRPWAILPEALTELRQGLYSEAGLDALEADIFAAESEEAKRGRGRPPKFEGNVAVVPLQGVLRPGMSLMEMLFGIGGGLRSFQRGFSQAMSDPDIGAIVMDIDSPGGMVDQIPETAAMIRAGRESKHIVAVSNTFAASAAYWLAAQANEIVVTPSGEIGSIGVYCMHVDMSKALDERGLKPTLISAGKFKVEGNPYSPLEDEAKAFMQQGVDDFYDMFVKDVATGRGVSAGDVKSGYGEGRVLPARRAVDAGLADRVDTLDTVISGLVSRSRGSNSNSSNGEYTSEERERLVELHTSLSRNK